MSRLTEPANHNQNPSPAAVPDVGALGLALRRQRESMRLTQAEAAGLAGVSHRLWSEVERGVRPNASLNTVLRMLQTAGMDMQLTVRARPTPGPGKKTPRKPTS
jgi:transcriptional regulator with XRE-family HTH domain